MFYVVFMECRILSSSADHLSGPYCCCSCQYNSINIGYSFNYVIIMILCAWPAPSARQCPPFWNLLTIIRKFINWLWCLLSLNISSTVVTRNCMYLSLSPSKHLQGIVIQGMAAHIWGYVKMTSRNRCSLCQITLRSSNFILSGCWPSVFIVVAQWMIR